MPNISDAYLTVIPRLAAGSEATVNRNAKVLGNRAGKAASDAFNKAMTDNTEVASGKAGKKAGTNFSEGFSKDTQGRMRDNKGKFVKAGEQAGDSIGKGVDRGIRTQQPGLNRTTEESGKKAGKAFGGGLLGGIGPIVKGLVATYLGAKLVQGLGDSIRAASDLQETMSKTKNVFKTSSKSVIDWSRDSATSFGLSQNAALSAASQFGDMFSQLGAGTEEAAVLSKEVVKLAADLGSFHNLDTAETLDLISSAMRGEYDSIQKILPAISDARVKQEAMNATGKESEEQLTAQDKAMAALAVITEDSANATNDFSETSDSLANQQKTLAARIENTKSKIGEALLPAMTGIVTFINDRAIPAFDKFFAGLTGKSSTEGDMDNIILKGEDMGLMADQVTTEFNEWYFAGKDVKSALQDIGDALQGVADAYTENQGTFNALLGFIGGLTVAAKVAPAFTAMSTAIRGIGVAATGVVAGGLALLVGTIAGLVGGLGVVIASALSTEDHINRVKDTINGITWLPGWLKNIYFALLNAGQGVKNFFQWIGRLGETWGTLQIIFNSGITLLTGAFRNFWEQFNTVFQNVKRFLEVVFLATMSFVWQQVQVVWNKISTIFTNGWNWLITVFNRVKHVLEVVFLTALNFVLNGAKLFWNGISAGFTWLKDRALAAFNFLKLGLHVIWEWIIRNVFNPIVRFVTKTIPDKFRSMKEAVVGVFGKMKDAIANIWDDMMATGRSAINGVGKFINKIIVAVNKIPFINIGLLPDPLIAKPTKKAMGGHVTGGPPGTDTVPAIGPRGKPYLLDNGEHILTKQEVNRMGGQAGVYAFRRNLMSGAAKYADGGHIRDGKYRPGMGNLGMTDALVKLYRKFGGKGNYTSGYRPNGQDWHGSGLAADFGGYNQDSAAYKLKQKGEGLLELIHSTNSANYGVSRGRNHNFGEPLWSQHKNHLHLASTPEAISALLGGNSPYGPAGGGGVDIFNWLLSGPGRLAKSALKTAISGLKKVLPKEKGVVPSAIRGIGLGIPQKALDYFEDKGNTAPFSGTSGRRGARGDWATMLSAFTKAKSMGASNKVLLALFEAGFVESNFRNLTTAVDHDSLGFLQQRPSMGWPNPTHVPTATASFVRRAKAKEDNYRTAGQLAQAVQVSAFPHRYDEARGRAISALQKIWPSYVAGNYAKGGAVYDNGGWLGPGQMGMNQGNRPEAVLTPEESQGLKQIGAGELLREMKLLREAVLTIAPAVNDGIDNRARNAMVKSRRF